MIKTVLKTVLKNDNQMLAMKGPDLEEQNLAKLKINLL